MAGDTRKPTHGPPPEDGEATKVTRNSLLAVRASTPGPRGSLVVVYVPHENARAAADLGRRIVVEHEIVIGRGDTAGLKLDQEDISRRHCRIWRENGQYRIEDHGSVNGTWVNGEMIAGPRDLPPDARIAVGQSIVKFIQSEQEDQFHEVIYRLRVEDALTGSHNKRYLLEFLDRELARVARTTQPLSLVMYDIDHFKKVNDTWGHLAGDAVLRDTAGVVKALVRKEQCFARYGGEEFAVVLPDTPLEKAVVFGEKMRAQIAASPFKFQGIDIPVTVSLGVAQALDPNTTVEQLIARADERLYKAKQSGRNRVVAE